MPGQITANATAIRSVGQRLTQASTHTDQLLKDMDVLASRLGSTWQGAARAAFQQAHAQHTPDLRRAVLDLKLAADSLLEAAPAYEQFEQAIKSMVNGVMGVLDPPGYSSGNGGGGGGGSSWGGGEQGSGAPTTAPTIAPGDPHGLGTKVPFVSQWRGSDGGGNCGPASIAMVMQYFGAKTELKDVVPLLPRVDHGTNPFASDHIFAQLGKPELTWNKIDNLAELRSQLDSDHPIVAQVNNGAYIRMEGDREVPYPSGGGTHYVQEHIVVVTNYSLDEHGQIKSVFINDPLAVMPNGKGGMVADGGHGANFEVPIADWLKANEGRYSAAVGRR